MNYTSINTLFIVQLIANIHGIYIEFFLILKRFFFIMQQSCDRLDGVIDVRVFISEA